LSLGPKPTDIEPALASSYKMVSPTDYTFTLRSGVTFHNGDPLTADDVVFSLERIVNPKQNSPYQTLYDFKSVTAPNATTVEIKLNHPQASLLSLLAQPWSGGIVDKKWMESESADALKTQENGTGPYKLESYQVGSVIKTVRFANYWDKPKPYINEVDYRDIPDESTLVQALKSGSVDMGQVTLPTNYTAVKSAGLQVGPTYPTATEWIAVNTLAGPMADLRVRQAVSLAIDRQQIMKIVGGDSGVLASIVPPGDPMGCTMSESSPYYKRDVAKAKSLLAEAGKSNLTLTVEVQSEADGAQATRALQLMKQQLSQAGITLNIQPIPFTNLVNDLTAGKWHSDMLELTSVLNADASQYLALWFAKGAASTKVNDPKLWDMMSTAVQETGGTSARKADYQNICNYVAQNVYQLNPFASAGRWDVWNSKVHGFTSDVTNTRLFLKDAWLG
jgi:peptide/nickel transport system substrate-binding protein